MITAEVAALTDHECRVALSAVARITRGLTDHLECRDCREASVQLLGALRGNPDDTRSRP